MFYFAGGFFILLGLIRLIAILASSGRPKTDARIKEFFMGKLKGDFLGIGKDQRHAKVTYTVNGQEYEGDIFVHKFKGEPGDIIPISYKKNDPKSIKPSNMKVEVMGMVIMFVTGIILCIVNWALMALWN